MPYEDETVEEEFDGEDENDGETVATDTSGDGKSIVSSKYRERYKNREPDFVARLLKNECVEQIEIKDKDNKVTGHKDGKTDITALFTICRTNKIDVDKYVNNNETHGFAGRFRMTVGNMLRSRAKKRHGLFDVKGEWHDMSDEDKEASGVTGDPTETREGEKIAAPKVEKETKDEAETEAA